MEWISEKDRLPGENERIIGTNGFYVGEFTYVGGDYQWVYGLTNNPIYVTHWMPLPEPPKEDA